MGAYCGYGGYFRRLSDIEERKEFDRKPAHVKTPGELTADFWLQYEEQRKKREEEHEQQKLEEQRQRQERARQAEELNRRRAAYIVKTRLLASMWEAENATPAEIKAVNARVAESTPDSFGDPDVHRTALMLLRTQQQAATRIAAVRNQCTNDEWRWIQREIHDPGNGWTPSEIASGIAHEDALASLQARK